MNIHSNRALILPFAALALFTMACSAMSFFTESGVSIPTNGTEVVQAAGTLAVRGGQVALTEGAEVAQTAIAVAQDPTALAGTSQAIATSAVGFGQSAATKSVIVAQTAAAVATKVNAQGVASDDAKAIIETYLQDILGVNTQPRFASGFSGGWQPGLHMSDDAEQAAEEASNAALVTYGAVFTEPRGVGSVSYGDGTLNGRLDVDINAASVGSFSFSVDAPAPTNEAEALALVVQTFPKLAQYTFAVDTENVNRYSWKASGRTPGFDSETWEATMVTDEIRAGVIDRSDGVLNLGVIVYVVVGRGTLASAVGD